MIHINLCIAEHSVAGSWLLENTSEMFSRARIPAAECDSISEPPPIDSPDSRSILLMIHDWCYSVVVYQPRKENDIGSPRLFSPGEIEARIRAVALDVESRLAAGERPVPIGLLSADQRDKWAKVHGRHIILEQVAYGNPRICIIFWTSRRQTINRIKQCFTP